MHLVSSCQDGIRSDPATDDKKIGLNSKITGVLSMIANQKGRTAVHC